MIEDIGVTRAGIKAELEATGMTVLAFADAAACLARLQAEPVDVVVCDLYLAGESGPPALPTLRALAAGGTPVIVYSTWALDPDVLAALDAGAVAYLQKGADVAALRRVIERVRDLPGAADPILTPEVAAAVRRRERFGLTAAELEVLTYVGQHLTNQEIAQLRSVTEETVKTQLASIRSKLGAANRAAAVRTAHRHGLMGRWNRAGASS